MNKGISRYCPFKCPLLKVALHPRNERGGGGGPVCNPHHERAWMVGQVARAVASFIHTIQVSSKRELDENCWDSERHTAHQGSEPVFVNLLRSPGIDSQPGGPVRQPYLTYRPAYMATKVGGIGFLESIPGLHKRLQIRAPVKVVWHQIVSHFIFLTLSL
jgi:hypothetical protein